MKNHILFIISILSLASCEPAVNCVPNCAGKRIRFIESGGKFNRITYDDQNRQLLYIQAIDTLITYTYETDFAKSIQQNFGAEYITDDTIVLGRTLITESLFPSSGTKTIYEYDAAGHLIKGTQHKNATTIYTWLNGNMVKLERVTGVSPVQSIEYTYETNIVNSTGNEFKGIGMFGKTSVNALKSSNSNGVITNFAYEVDGCGCITKSIATSPGNVVEQKFVYELIP